MVAVSDLANPGTMWDQQRVSRRLRQAQRLTARGFAGEGDLRPYKRRLEAAKAVRRHIEPLWREVQDYLAPFLGRYLRDDGPAADGGSFTPDYSLIRDPSATKMVMTAADGMHGGLTNQAEQWFNFYAGNYERYEATFSGQARDWIIAAQECTRDTLAKSNFYSAAYDLYLENFCFGSALMLVMADPQDTARYFTKTAGSYWWVPDSRGRIETVFVRTVSRARDLVEDYGEENCPDRVKQVIEDGNADKLFNVIQCIQPWNHFGLDQGHDSYQYEDVRFLEGGNDEDKPLYRGGYQSKPFVALRWGETGDYPYSMTCPGIEALPDIKQLQVLTVDYNQALKWRVDPAWLAPTDKYESIEPGGIYQFEGSPADHKFTALVPPDFDLPAVTQAIQDIRERISAVMYNREILLVQSRQRQITATEVAQLVQEKNAVLGPIIARIGDSALIPILDRTLDIILNEWRILQDPPAELDGAQIKPYFTGELARAQRQGGVIQQVTQTISIFGQLVQFDPTLASYLDAERMLQGLEDSDILAAGALRPKEEAQQRIQEQQEAMAQQQQMASMEQALNMAKTAGQASTGPETLLGQMAGAAQPEAQL